MRINSLTLVEVLAALAILHLLLFAWIHWIYLPDLAATAAYVQQLDPATIKAANLRDLAANNLQTSSRLVASIVGVYLALFALLFALALRVHQRPTTPAVTPADPS